MDNSEDVEKELDNVTYGASESIVDDSANNLSSPAAPDKGISQSNSSNPLTSNEDVEIQPNASMLAVEIKQEKYRIWKNVCVVSVSFLCLLTTYSTMSSLQSSINSDKGLGTISQATMSFSLIFSSLFVSTWVVKTVGIKWTMVITQLTYSVYISAQFYPTFATLIPGAVILGIGGAPLWTAQGTFFTQAGNRYTTLIGGSSPQESISRFFGVFFMFFQSSTIWGNLISSSVLSSGVRYTNISNDRINNCGVNFCYENVDLVGDDTSDSTNNKPLKETIQLLMGILLGISLLAAVIIAVLMDSPKKYNKQLNLNENMQENKSDGLTRLISTFHQMRKPYQLLIIPLTLWPGFELGFLTADFTTAFITCPWGVEHIGYIFIAYGVFGSIGSIVVGSIVKKIGRLPIFIFGAILNYSLIFALLFFWWPDPSQPIIFYAISAIWGVSDSVWQTQLNTFYGVIFTSDKEAAFSNFRLWRSIGILIAYAYSHALCVKVKLYVLIAILSFGMVGYLIIEVKEKKKKPENKK